MMSDLQSGPEMVSDDDIQERVLKVIAVTKRLPRESVSPDSSFESLGIDSLDRLNILFDLESEFDIQINDEDAKQVETIPQMVEGVRQLVAAGVDAAAVKPAPVSGPRAVQAATMPATVGAEEETRGSSADAAGAGTPEEETGPSRDPAGPAL